MHIHLSETQAEHEECKQRHGMTPAAYMQARGVFDVPTTAAHCVWLEGEDFDILKAHGVTVACCPASNLKLASGYANVPRMLDMGINVALGTDGAASNNNLNILQDLYLFAVAYKGYYHDSTLITPAQALYAATRAGALAQGREDSGRLAVGCKADLCVIDTDTPQFTPMTDAACNVVYAAQGADVRPDDSGRLRCSTATANSRRSTSKRRKRRRSGTRTPSCAACEEGRRCWTTVT